MASSRRAGAQPAVASGLDRARAAWDAGEYEQVLLSAAALRFERREDRVAAALLRARALLALDRPGDVGAILERVRKEAKGTEETVLVQMLAGAALTRTSARERGHALLDEAAALAGRGAKRLSAEVAYYRALSRWSARQLPEAEAIIEAALPAATGVIRSRLLQLLGWIDVRRENYAAAAPSFTAALEALDAADGADVKGRARILNALGIIAAETIDLRLGRLVRRQYHACTWSDDTRIERFYVLEYLSWLSLLEGEIVRAWDERQLALSLTVDSSHHALALIGAALVSTVVGDRFSASRYLEVAGALLLRGDQVDLDVERRIAMLSFAIAVPPAELETAQKVLALYDRTRPRRTEMLSIEGDRRLEAYELQARGKVALAEGHTAQGVALLERSLELWTRLSYRLRAALTADDLRTATGDRRYAQIAIDALRNTTNAWLRKSLEARSTEDDAIGQLTPAERRVLGELCKGKKAREIAGEFERSFNTINNHTRAIFFAFNVRTRAALVAKCAKLGLLDELRSPR